MSDTYHSIENTDTDNGSKEDVLRGNNTQNQCPGSDTHAKSTAPITTAVRTPKENGINVATPCIDHDPIPASHVPVTVGTHTAEALRKNTPRRTSKDMPTLELSTSDTSDTRSEALKEDEPSEAATTDMSISDNPEETLKEYNPFYALKGISQGTNPPHALARVGTPAEMPQKMNYRETSEDIGQETTAASLAINVTNTRAETDTHIDRGEASQDKHLRTKDTPAMTYFDASAETSKENSPGPTPQCPTHPGSLLLHYCTKCSTAACERCLQEDHKDHPAIDVSEAATTHRASLTTLLTKLRMMTPEIERAVTEADNAHKQLEVNTAEAEVKISSLFDELATLLEDRRRTALSGLAQMSASREAVLHKQQESLSQRLEGVRSCCRTLDVIVQGERDVDVVMAQTQVERNLPDLLSPTPDTQPQPNSLIAFDDREIDALKRMVSLSGSVDNNTADPYQTTVTGDALSGCLAGKMASVTVTTRDRNGFVVKTGLAPLSAFISPEKQEARLSVTIVDLNNGTYEIRFLLPKAGLYFLNVFLFDQATVGSPYRIAVLDGSAPGGRESSRSSRNLTRNQPSVKEPSVKETSVKETSVKETSVKETSVKEPSGKRLSSCSRTGGSCSRLARPIDDDLILRIGVRGRNKGEFSNPQGVCCHGDKVIVADSSNQVVQVFTMTGEFCLKFGSPGCCPGKIQRPTGVAVNHSGNYLVADYDNKWISVFSPDGRFISHMGAGSLQGPKGVAVDRDDHVIVVDNKCNSVLVFQPNGRLITKLGGRGPWAEQLAGPHYAAVNEDCDIIVTDFHNHCVKVYDVGGKFKFSFGSNGEGNGQFNAPTGVAVDDRGNIIVADWGNSRIQVFDPSGSFLSFVNTASEPLSGPQGLAVTSQSVVVVADSGNHCIKYYKYLQ